MPRFLPTLCFVALLPAPLAAQLTGQAGISVSGSADLSKPPEIIRLHVKQYAKGNDEEAAKSALVVAEKKLMAKLAESGAEVVHASPALPQPSQNLQGRYQNFHNMTINRRQLGGVINNGRAEIPAIFLERYVSVDVRPKTKQKDVLALTAELQDKFRKEYQEVSGLNEVYPKEDPNDAQVNGMQAQVFRNDMNYYQQDVRFFVATRITREDRLKLYGVAVKKARSIAEDLAAATGVALGDLQTISSTFTASGTNNYVMTSGSVPLETLRFPFFKDDATCEAVAVRQLNANFGQGYQPAAEPLTYQITLSVSYKIDAKR
jgi:hypothetical protein